MCKADQCKAGHIGANGQPVRAGRLTYCRHRHPAATELDETAVIEGHTDIFWINCLLYAAADGKRCLAPTPEAAADETAICVDSQRVTQPAPPA